MLCERRFRSIVPVRVQTFHSRKSHFPHPQQARCTILSTGNQAVLELTYTALSLQSEATRVRRCQNLPYLQNPLYCVRQTKHAVTTHRSPEPPTRVNQACRPIVRPQRCLIQITGGILVAEWCEYFPSQTMCGCPLRRRSSTVPFSASNTPQQSKEFLCLVAKP